MWSRGRPKRVRWSRAVLAAGFLLASSVPRAFPDAFSILPAKDAPRARQVLVRLDAALDVWTDLDRRLTAEVRVARGSGSGIEGSNQVKILLDARLRGVWTPGTGPSRAKARVTTLDLAGQLESILVPQLDRLDSAALAGLVAEWLPRARRVPGTMPEYLEFAERAAAAGPSGARFALRALLALDPDIVSLRLAPEPGDPAKSVPGVTVELEEEAGRIRRIRAAAAALERASPALGVPELPWSEGEGAEAEGAARALSLVNPTSRAGILEASGIPGIQVLPAFLAGLSPEDRETWARSRPVSTRAVDIFLSCVPGAFEPAPGASSADAVLPALIALGELEREIARGTTGLPLLVHLTDPALRLALRSPRAAPGVRTALSDAGSRLTADLEAELARIAGGAACRVDISEEPGASGFSTVRAYVVSSDGVLDPVPPERVRSALAGILSGIRGGAGRIQSGLDLGLVVEPGGPLPGSFSEDSSVPADLPRELLDASGALSLRALSPASFAARTVYVQDRFRRAARTAGIPPAYTMPAELVRLTRICRARCLGLVEDAEVARSMEALGGSSGAILLWETTFSNLEAARASLSVYLGKETIR